MRMIKYHWQLDVYKLGVEAAETQGWLEYAVKCGYLNRNTGRQIHRTYDRILGKLVTMGNNPKRWVLAKSTDS